MIANLLIPVVVLATLAVLVTRGVEALMPETLTGIALTAGLSALALWLVSAGLFAGLYALQLPQPQARALIRAGGAAHFALLGAKAAMIWAPVMALVIVTAPRRWRNNTW